MSVFALFLRLNVLLSRIFIFFRLMFRRIWACPRARCYAASPRRKAARAGSRVAGLWCFAPPALRAGAPTPAHACAQSQHGATRARIARFAGAHNSYLVVQV
jgi:hypothetical protein